MKTLWSKEIRGQKFGATKIPAKIRRPCEFFFKDNFVFFCFVFFVFSKTQNIYFLFFLKTYF